MILKNSFTYEIFKSYFTTLVCKVFKICNFVKWSKITTDKNYCKWGKIRWAKLSGLY